MKFLNKINLKINEDFYDRIKVKQNDTARYLLFNLLDNGVPFSLENKTVRVYGLKPDGTKVFNNLTIINAAKGLAELQLTTQMLVKPGCLKLELVIYEATDILSTTKFDIDIISCIRDDGAIESTNEFSALTLGLSKLDEWDKYFKETSGAIEEKYTERLNGIASSLEETKNKVDFTMSGKLITPFGCNYYSDLETIGWDLNTFKTIADGCKAMGQDVIVLLPFAFLTNYTDSTLITFYEHDNKLKQCIEYAISIGLKPNLKCHIVPKDKLWQAEINPTDISAFFVNLTEFELHYARIAEQYNMDIFCIGEENKKISSKNRDLWLKLINDIRAVYNGEITYGCNFSYHSDEQITCCFLDLLDIIGLDCYHPLSCGLITDYSITKMYATESVLKNVETIRKTYNKPIMFTEFGFGRWQGGCLIPNGESAWDYTTNKTRPLEMINGYKAILDTFGNIDWFRGFWYWSEKEVNNTGNLMSICSTNEMHEVIKSYKGVI